MAKEKEERKQERKGRSVHMRCFFFFFTLSSFFKEIKNLSFCPPLKERANKGPNGQIAPSFI